MSYQSHSKPLLETIIGNQSWITATCFLLWVAWVAVTWNLLLGGLVSCCVLFLMQNRITLNTRGKCSKSVFWHGCWHASVGKPFRVWVEGCRNGKQMAPKWIRNDFEWIEMVLNGSRWLWIGLIKMVFPDFFACSIYFQRSQKPLFCQGIFMLKPFRTPPSQQQTSASAASQQQRSASSLGLGKYRPKRYGIEMVLRNGYKVLSNALARKFKIYGFCRKEIHNPGQHFTFGQQKRAAFPAPQVKIAKQLPHIPNHLPSALRPIV